MMKDGVTTDTAAGQRYAKAFSDATGIRVTWTGFRQERSGAKVPQFSAETAEDVRRARVFGIETYLQAEPQTVLQQRKTFHQTKMRALQAAGAFAFLSEIC